MIDIDKDWLSSQYSLRFDAIELVVDSVNRTYRARAGQKYFYLRLYRVSNGPLIAGSCQSGSRTAIAGVMVLSEVECLM
ncbi:hypothetical protein NKJ11_30950, partial [Mesorhizobium sp. M0243]